MAAPKRRKTSSRRDMRRSHDALRIAKISIDQTTGESHLRHHISENGYYRGKQIFKVKIQDKDDQE